MRLAAEDVASDAALSHGSTESRPTIFRLWRGGAGWRRVVAARDEWNWIAAGTRADYRLTVVAWFVLEGFRPKGSGSGRANGTYI